MLHIVINPAQSLLVLLHAESQAVLKLLLLRENSAIVDLCYLLPLAVELLLNVDDHIVAVPLTAVLHILDQSVADLADLDSGEDLSYHVLLNAIPAPLELVE